MALLEKADAREISGAVNIDGSSTKPGDLRRASPCRMRCHAESVFARHAGKKRFQRKTVERRNNPARQSRRPANCQQAEDLYLAQRYSCAAMHDLRGHD